MGEANMLPPSRAETSARQIQTINPKTAVRASGEWMRTVETFPQGPVRGKRNASNWTSGAQMGTERRANMAAAREYKSTAGNTARNTNQPVAHPTRNTFAQDHGKIGRDLARTPKKGLEEARLY